MPLRLPRLGGLEFGGRQEDRFARNNQRTIVAE